MNKLTVVVIVVVFIVIVIIVIMHYHLNFSLLVMFSLCVTGLCGQFWRVLFHCGSGGHRKTTGETSELMSLCNMNV